MSLEAPDRFFGATGDPIAAARSAIVREATESEAAQLAAAAAKQERPRAAPDFVAIREGNAGEARYLAGLLAAARGQPNA